MLIRQLTQWRAKAGKGAVPLPTREAEGYGLRVLSGAGLLLIVGCVALFLLLLPNTLWASSNVVIEQWPAFFKPIQTAVLKVLEELSNGRDFGLLVTRVYHLILLWLFVVYLFVVFRAFRSSAFSERPGRDGRAYLWFILAITAVAMGILLFAAGAFTGDLHSYVWYARVFAAHGGNPYIDVPSTYAAFDTGNWLRYLYWTDLPSPYGPVWTFLAGNLYMLTKVMSDQLVAQILSQKLLAIMVHLANTWLVWHIAGQIIPRYSPDRGRLRERVEDPSQGRLPVARERGIWWRGAQVGATLTYAWNPLLLIEFGVSGHNDGLAILGLLGALWLHLAGKWRWAVLLLALGSLVKVTEGLMFLVPYVGFLFWERRRNGTESNWALLRGRLARVGQAAGIIAVAWIVAWLPFWRGPETLKAFTNNPGSIYYIHSLGTVIRYTIPSAIERTAKEANWEIAGSFNARQIGNSLDKPTRNLLQAITALIVLLAVWRARTFKAMLAALWWTAFAYLAIGSIWYWPWYASWLLVPMALLGPGRLFTAGQIFCIASLSIYGLNVGVTPVLEWWWAWSGLIINGPPLAYLLASYTAEKLARWRARRAESLVGRQELSSVEA